MPYDITISLQLEVLPTNKVIVPGCEPLSAISSATLARFMDCENNLVDLDAALAAIPGSYVTYGSNFGVGQTRRKWYVFPPLDTSCPCKTYDDYYQILKEISTPEEPETLDEVCGVIHQGFCPSPDFNTIAPPPPNPYVSEHTLQGGIAVQYPVSWSTTTPTDQT